MKKTPTGFVAICQCGVIVGAMDYSRIDRREAGQMLGKWLHEGCTVEPQFAGTWSATVEACRCAPSNDEDVPGARVCEKNHNPRWYAQTNDNPHDMDYGYKRKCGDYEDKRK